LKPYHRFGSLLLAGILLAAYTSLSFSQQAKTPAIEPQAERILQQMSDYLKAKERFSFHVDATYEIVPYDQKLQFSVNSKVAVERPDKLQVTAEGDILDKRLWYNGKTFTLLNVELNQYATAEVSGDLDKALEYASSHLGIVVPAADFVVSDPYRTLMQNARAGYYIGLYKIEGTECHQLAFSRPDIDWQIWIEAGDKPVPRKLVITYKSIPTVPEYIGIFKDWNFSPQFTAELFNFRPPVKAAKIEFQPIQAAAASVTTPPAAKAPATSGPAPAEKP
jgi:hypothetical protein